MPSAITGMLNPDYRDILSAFADEKVEFLVVGAYALAAHGFVRATGDIDLWVRPNRENADRVMRALATFGAPLKQVAAEDFSAPGSILQIGVVPRRIDVLTEISGVTFDEAWPERDEVEIDGITVPVLDRENLARNKEATGRPQDQIDLEWLRRTDDP